MIGRISSSFLNALKLDYKPLEELRLMPLKRYGCLVVPTLLSFTQKLYTSQYVMYGGYLTLTN
jgi:hypothetical protein